MDARITELLEELKQAIDKAATTGDKYQFIDPAYDLTDELEQCEKPFDAVRPILELIESSPNIDFGGPGPLGSFMEKDVYKRQVYTTSGRIPDVELTAFQVLDNGQNDSGAPQGYAKDSRQVYFHNGDGKVKIIKGAEVSSFRSLGDTYFARDEKRIYAYGKQLPKAELTSWELLGHWYSRDARRVYYLNREIKGADRDSFTVCTLSLIHI